MQTFPCSGCFAVGRPTTYFTLLEIFRQIGNRILRSVVSIIKANFMDQAYFVIIAAFLSIFGTAYTYFSYRNKERLALIDSGLSPDAFKQMARGKQKYLMVFGLVFIGFSFGILSGFFFEKYLLTHYNPNNYRNYPQAYLTMVPLWVGIFLITSFYVSKRNDK